MIVLNQVEAELVASDRSGTLVLEIGFRSRPHSDWVIGLVTLEYGLTERVMLGDRGRAMRVAIEASDALAPYENRVTRADGEYRLVLSKAALGAWIGFFLKYHRDGIAEVDHVDTEATIVGTARQACTILLRVAEFEPPLHPDEIRKKFGPRAKRR